MPTAREWLGDPDFVKVPLAGLISKAYAAHLRALISPDRARPAAEIRAGEPQRYESDQTTHFSIVDGDGNAVSNTYTLNFSYGCGLVAEGTGVLLNNELDDFAAKPGAANAYGLMGGEANAPGPGKRPLSSMSPTLVFKDGKVELVTGSPGGSRIITTVLQIIVNVIDHGLNVAEAENAPRAHDQLWPDELRIERGISPDTIRLLEAMGHKVVGGEAMGSANTIARSPDGVLTGRLGPAAAGDAGGGVLRGIPGVSAQEFERKYERQETHEPKRDRAGGAAELQPKRLERQRAVGVGRGRKRAQQNGHNGESGNRGGGSPRFWAGAAANQPRSRAASRFWAFASPAGRKAASARAATYPKTPTATAAIASAGAISIKASMLLLPGRVQPQS